MAKKDSWLQGMPTLEPSGKRYFERTSALSEVGEMKAPNDYTICLRGYEATISPAPSGNILGGQL